MNDAAGPAPLKYTPLATTFCTVHVCPAGTTKSSAARLSNASLAVSKSCELVPFVPGLEVWSYSTAGVPAGVHVAATVAVDVAVAATVDVDVAVAVFVAVLVGVFVDVLVGVLVAVFVGVDVNVAVAVAVGVGVTHPPPTI